MMTFTILGTMSGGAGNPAYRQDSNTFLNSKFIFANGKEIQCYTDAKVNDEQDFTVDATKLLTDSFTFQKLW
jgi:hypothetical protein